MDSLLYLSLKDTTPEGDILTLPSCASALMVEWNPRMQVMSYSGLGCESTRINVKIKR